MHEETEISKERKALLVIECLSANMASPDVDASTRTNALESIYKFAHVALGDCKNDHADWVDELEVIYKHLRSTNAI